jgi:transcription initiation factor TFIIIB Brf1 subunit/transcription initiation factor TFIIB
MVEPVCEICEKEQHEVSQEFYEREHVCDKCWSDWQQEKQEQERDYWRSRL